MANAVRVDGARTLARQLGQLGGTAAQAVRDEVRRSAERVQQEAQRIVPVDTGRLRDSIRTEILVGDLAARIGTDVEYAQDVEFGTRSTNAQPYLFPAAEAERHRLVGAVQAAIGAAVRRAA